MAKWRKYRKRPVVVRARPAIAGEEIATLEGTMMASDGDMIIEGVNGEKYPCKPDVFGKSYEYVRDEMETTAMVACLGCNARLTGQAPDRCICPK